MSKNLIFCDICGETFSTANARNIHKRIYHHVSVCAICGIEKPLEQMTEDMFYCKQCYAKLFKIYQAET